jgi:HEAT repeat protein
MGTLPLALVLGLLILAPGQAATDLQATIAQLGSFDFDTRTTAARTLRRAPAPEVVPALEAAARSHVDQYVRFRALVLLSGLDTGAMTRVSTELVGDRNDRVRAVAYQWFEHHPQAAVLPRLLDALPNETSEFVRPALTRALVASGESPDVQRAVRPLVLKGEDMFRGSVIAALGDHRGAYAIEELLAVVALDGPLQDDAITAIGRIGNPSTRSVIAGLQKTVPRELQPTVSAALCLLQVDCPARVHAAGVLAGAGHGEAFEALIDAAMAAEGAARDAVTLGVGNVILRQPLLALRVFETRQQPAAVAELFRDGFDMLSEDFDKEQFGAEVRRTLWATPEGAVRRQAAASLLDALEF